MCLCSNISEKRTSEVELVADSVTGTASSLPHLSHFLLTQYTVEEALEASRGYRTLTSRTRFLSSPPYHLSQVLSSDNIMLNS